MGRLMTFFIEGVFWLQLFLFPLFLASIPAVIIFNSSVAEWAMPTVIGILIAGAATGVWFAERIRKKHGACSRFFGKLLGD